MGSSYDFQTASIDHSKRFLIFNRLYGINLVTCERNRLRWLLIMLIFLLVKDDQEMDRPPESRSIPMGGRALNKN